MCDFSDAYIVLKRDIVVTEPNNAKRMKRVAFKNNPPFIKCISKINCVQIDNAEDLQCQCTIFLNTAKITKKQQGVCGIIQR